MNYEVEQKFALDDKASFIHQLDALGVQWHDTVRQEDAYFDHPSRDYASTDEALRVRLDGDRALFTYKGPRVDSITKTRQELELMVSNPGPEVKLFYKLPLLESLPPSSWFDWSLPQHLKASELRRREGSECRKVRVQEVLL